VEYCRYHLGVHCLVLLFYYDVNMYERSSWNHVVTSEVCNSPPFFFGDICMYGRSSRDDVVNSEVYIALFIMTYICTNVPCGMMSFRLRCVLPFTYVCTNVPRGILSLPLKCVLPCFNVLL